MHSKTAENHAANSRARIMLLEQTYSIDVPVDVPDKVFGSTQSAQTESCMHATSDAAAAASVPADFDIINIKVTTKRALCSSPPCPQFPPPKAVLVRFGYHTRTMLGSAPEIR